jgi:hypothetical protein
VGLFCGGPIRYFETLEESTGASVEIDFSHSLKEGVGMEILSVNVMLNVRLFVEFIAIEVLNSNTYIILNY